MVFENMIKETHHISCLNGAKTMEKKFKIERELAEEFNKIVDVINANTDIKITHSMLFTSIFKKFLGELETSASEDDALVNVLTLLMVE